MNEIVLTFAGANAAIAAERALVAGGLEVRVMNTPAAIRAGCGICLRVDPGDLPAALGLLPAAARPEGLYVRRAGGQYVPLEAKDNG